MGKVRWFYTYKSTFKGVLFVIAMSIVLAQIWYTQSIVKKLREDQRNILELNVKQISSIASSNEIPDLTFFFENVIKNIRFPIILTNPEGQITDDLNLGLIDKAPYEPETLERLRSIMTAMDNENEPIPIRYNETLLNIIHYGDSELISMLNWLPVVEVFTVGLFVLLAFIGLRNIQRSEQRFIWVGMAKETAHQLGTPISSLYGWLELAQVSEPSEKTKEIISEMQKDMYRLNKVAQRFSQIGSERDLTPFNLSEILHELIEYFRRRLPQTGKSVVIGEDYDDGIECKINRDLFEWAVENLVKNSLDAIENGKGKIQVDLKKHENTDWIIIEVTDNGKGMNKQQQKSIYKPGFSTKKRGWGLGLNFTKRIIEDYHKGKLILRSSRPNEGTIMRILLK
ncbi:MAG: HAMP domain-containing histidine kinase [bacterium]|nr:HAMP domain-containing histidine kinase [bacterium]